MAHGATPEDWVHFDLVLGLTEDLLPVVSNPSARISPHSSMKSVGKIPSVRNRAGDAVSIPKWPTKRSTRAQLDKWAAEDDYGICVQTRLVRALDIDVADAALSQAIQKVIRVKLGDINRKREGTGKCLFPFVLPGEFGKRTVKVEGGIVEFLATGQQFVAAGTHPSGTRYEWEGGLPAALPELTLEEFEALWAALVAEFAVEAPTDAKYLQRRPVGGAALPDDTLDALVEVGAVLGWSPDGTAFITCPWKDEHTSDSGPSETAYFPRGTRGYEQGHFKCLHAHCVGRSDHDFVTAFKLHDKDFEDLTPTVVPGAGANQFKLVKLVDGTGGALTEFKGGLLKQNQSTQEYFATISNVCYIMQFPEMMGMEIRYDTFSDEIVLRRADGKWRMIKDADYTELRLTLEKRKFMPVNKDMVRDAVHYVAEYNRIDTAIEWARSLEWDGVPRIEGFLHTHFGAEDGPYTRAVAMYMWTAMAGRCLEPGCQADMVPVLQGDEGLRKTSAVKAMAPERAMFREINFHDIGKADAQRKTRGALLGEIAELQGLNTRDEESILAFITRQDEQWVPKYKEFLTTFSRRLIFIGTTNREQFLTRRKNRRWLPFTVTMADAAAIRRDCRQLWAEAVWWFDMVGIQWEEAERLGPAARESFIVEDFREEVIKEWLKEVDEAGGSSPEKRGDLKTVNIIKNALILQGSQAKGAERDVARIMRGLGWVNKQKWIDGTNERVWNKQK